MAWTKDIARWTIGDTLYLSVPFTWLLPEARQAAQRHAGPVCAGGPAVDLMPGQISNVADTETPCPVDPLPFHNPLATFTTRGCPNRCPFCAVPRIEGEFREIPDFRPAPIVCDNNFLASSRAHFDRVIDRLQPLPYVDFNQGLEAALFTPYHARRLAELPHVKVRFAFDHANDEAEVSTAIKLAETHGLTDIGCYVLIGFRDTPEDARYRLQKIREFGYRPNPMRFQPLDAMTKNSYVGAAWTECELKRMVRYYSKLRWFEHIPYEEFNYQTDPADGRLWP